MRQLLTAAALIALAATATAAPPQLTPPQHDATHAMFEHIVDIPTVIGRHRVPEEAQYVADQFKAGGFPAEDIHVLPYHTGSATTGDDDTAALIVRWRAAGTPKAKPILLMGHMDVVEAKAEDWGGTDPFKMVEKDGYYYGRATIDMKDGITAITQAMINLKKAGFTPKRDIVVLFTGDEETNGIGAQKGALGDAMRRWLANPSDGEAADVIEASESEVGLTRTRCVPTRLFAGHADNALPQLATAMVNCRIFPGEDPNAVKAELEKIVNDPTVVVTRNDDYVASLASPLRPDVTAAFTKTVQTLHPGMPVFPEMSTGASDARPFRVAGIPVYGTNGAWVQVPTDFRAHGKDERIPVQSLYDNVVHWELMLRDLAGK